MDDPAGDPNGDERDDEDEGDPDRDGQRVGEFGDVAVAGDPVHGRAEPALAPLRTACGDLGIDGRERQRHGHGAQVVATSLTRWLTTRVDPPGGIDTP